MCETIINEKDKDALEKLKSMNGWEHDGFCTGTNYNDTFYVLNHEIDGENTTQFYKMTNKQFIEGDEPIIGSEMTASQVLEEVL